MPASALALALTAAVIHAVWNLLLAGARDSQAATAVALLVAALAGAPAAAADWHMTEAAFPFIAASAGLELVYVSLLAAAYDRAELSVVYPLARGLAPVFVLVGTVAATSARTSAAQAAGVVHASPLAYNELTVIPFAFAYAVAVALGRGLPALRSEIGAHTIVGGTALFAGYALVLFALRLAPAASVAAVRESSVLIATALAALFLRERVTPWRFAGAAFVVGGIVLLGA